MEIWDGYNKDRTLAGADIVRGESSRNDCIMRFLRSL